MDRSVLPSLKISRDKGLFRSHQMHTMGKVKQFLKREIRDLDSKPVRLVKHKIRNRPWIVGPTHRFMLDT